MIMCMVIYMSIFGTIGCIMCLLLLEIKKELQFRNTLLENQNEILENKNDILKTFSW